jgi:hypothetical protein
VRKERLEDRIVTRGDSQMSARRGFADEFGQATFSVVLVIIVVVLGGLLVWRIAFTAKSIDDKAGVIARTAVPINRATDAVTNVPRTNQLATEILNAARPLAGVLTEVRDAAKRIDAKAISINNTAGTIDGTARSINAEAVRIIAVARSIDRGVARIIQNLDVTIGTVATIRGRDTERIVRLAESIHQTGACVDRKLVLGADTGTGPNEDGHCAGLSGF